MPVSDLEAQAAGCALCVLRQRRQFTRLLAAGGALALGMPGAARAQPGGEGGVRDEVGRTSRATQLVSAEQIEGQAAQQYLQMAREYNASHALAPADHPQLQRLRSIAKRITPHAPAWNERARQWRWEVNLLISKELNAFCMPGGKIAFFSGILKTLQLNDDEVATVMGHEVAHALREHARAQAGKTMLTRGGIEIVSSLLGLGQLARLAADASGSLLALKFSRENETEADIVGMDLAARAGYNPAAGIGLWQKMLAANKGAPPQWMSTHPASATRIRDIQARLPKVQPLYDRAEKPTQRFEPFA